MYLDTRTQTILLGPTLNKSLLVETYGMSEEISRTTSGNTTDLTSVSTEPGICKTELRPLIQTKPTLLCTLSLSRNLLLPKPQLASKLSKAPRLQSQLMSHLPFSLVISHLTELSESLAQSQLATMLLLNLSLLRIFHLIPMATGWLNISIETARTPVTISKYGRVISLLTERMDFLTILDSLDLTDLKLK